MSITLEGNAVDAADGKYWSGTWRFTKEKKSFLAYTFKQSGNVVPRDLYDYVSFVNEPPSAITPIPPGRKSKDYKAKAKLKVNKVSRGRGRPPSISSLEGAAVTTNTLQTTAESVTESTIPPSDQDVVDDSNQVENHDTDNLGDGINDVTMDEIGEGEGEGEEDEQSELEQDNEGNNEEQEQLEETLGGPGDKEESDGGNQGSTSNTESYTVTVGDPVDSTEDRKPTGPDVELEVTHPLIGMWEGSFNVKIPTGIMIRLYSFC